MAAADAHRTRLRAERGANRAAIVTAAEDLLREQPFREVSIEELMQRAGLARTQFYRYFDDLSDLVLQVTRGAFEELLASHEALVEVADISEATLRTAIGEAVDTFAQHGPLVRAVSEAAVHDAAVEQAFGLVQDRYIALTERLVRRAADAGAPIGDPAQTARWLHAGNVAYLVEAFGGTPKVTPEVARDTIARLWFAVLGPRT
jgi:AcrR family transcriptional regulator